MMNEDLVDTPFKSPKVVLERPNRGMSWIGDIAPLELIKRKGLESSSLAA